MISKRDRKYYFTQYVGVFKVNFTEKLSEGTENDQTESFETKRIQFELNTFFTSAKCS